MKENTFIFYRKDLNRLAKRTERLGPYKSYLRTAMLTVKLRLCWFLHQQNSGGVE